MHKVYLLLRNNKQQGPYSLEELIKLSLKPMDLVWVEGRSVGWKYPTEIDSLKTYVIDASTTPEINIQTTFSEVKSENSEVVQQPIIKEKSIKQETPVRNDKRIFVSLPGGAAPAAIKLKEIKEESFSEKLERKAEELYKRTQEYAEKKEREKSEVKTEVEEEEKGRIDTKYARSLDDIKEEYSSWLYTQKRKKRSVPRINYTIAATILFLIIGFTVAKFVFSEKKSETIAEEKMSALPVSGQTEESLSTNSVPAKKSVSTKSKTNSKALSKQKKSNSAIVKNNKDKKSEKNIVTSDSRKTVASRSSNSNLSDLVKVKGVYASNQKGIPDFKITVTNNSNESLSFVAVDVFYYRKDGILAQKKTLYFNDVSAHQSLSLTAPGHSAAEDVIFRLGLMSSEKGELFYAKQ